MKQFFVLSIFYLFVISAFGSLNDNESYPKLSVLKNTFNSSSQNYKLGDASLITDANTTFFPDNDAIYQFEIVKIPFMENLDDEITTQLEREKKRWIPWGYIAGGVFAAGGTALKIHADNLYGLYESKVNVSNVDDKRSQIKQYDYASYVLFGIAGGCLITGAISHVKHLKQKKELKVTLQTAQQGATLGLCFKF